jgi:hypothetical protein
MRGKGAKAVIGATGKMRHQRPFPNPQRGKHLDAAAVGGVSPVYAGPMPRLFQAVGVRRERDCPASRFLAFREQPLLPANFREITEIDRRRAGRSGGLAHVGYGEIEIAVVVGHEVEEIGPVRLTGPNRKHLPAGPFPLRPPAHADPARSTVVSISIGWAIELEGAVIGCWSL